MRQILMMTFALVFLMISVGPSTASTSLPVISDIGLSSSILNDGEPIKVTVKRDTVTSPLPCLKVRVQIGNKWEERGPILFPYSFSVSKSSSLYPDAPGPFEIKVAAVSPDCKGSATAKAEIGKKGIITGAYLMNNKYASVDYYAGKKVQLSIQGMGKCHVSIVMRGKEAKYEGRDAPNALKQAAGNGISRDVVLDLPAVWESDYTLPPYHMQFSNGQTQLPAGKDAEAKVSILLSVMPNENSKAPCMVNAVAPNNANYFNSKTGNLNFGWQDLKTKCWRMSGNDCANQ